MGISPALDAIVGRRPDNWQVLRFERCRPEVPGEHLNFFVSLPRLDLVEAFGRSILEAAASGGGAVLPRTSSRSSARPAVYCEPAQVAALARGVLHARNPVAFQRQSARGSDIVPASASAPSRRWRGGDADRRPATSPPRRRRRGEAASRCSHLTSNGIGMGTSSAPWRWRAACPPRCGRRWSACPRPFGVGARTASTRVPALPLLRRHGTGSMERDSLVARDGGDPRLPRIRSSVRLRRQLPLSRAGATRLRAVSARASGRFWQRRAMWSPGSGQRHIAQEAHFDAVIEPGELAAAMDRGPTGREHRAQQRAGRPNPFTRARARRLDRDGRARRSGLPAARPRGTPAVGLGQQFRPLAPARSRCGAARRGPGRASSTRTG